MFLFAKSLLRRFLSYILIGFLLAVSLFAREAAHAGSGPLQTNQIYQASPGPWGEIEFYATYLRPPAAIVEMLLWKSEQTEWVVHELSLEECIEEFGRMGLSDVDLSWIRVPQGVMVKNGSHTFYPPHDLVERLSPLQRASLARFLSRWPESNSLYASPLIIANRSPEDWFAGEGVSDRIAELAASCCYPMGNQVVFSDYWLLADKMETLEEERAFTRNMYKQLTVVPQILLTEDCEIAGLGDYWSAGNQRGDVLSLLEGMDGMEGERTLDLTHLLPPLPRKLLNTYPVLEEGAAGNFPDCYWTSLNFFNYTAEKRYLGEDRVLSVLDEEYDKVTRPLLFGDVLLLSNPETGLPIHSAVYIADQIVFTKNGRSLKWPWVLMPLEEMLGLYLKEGELKLSFYRKKQ